MRYNSLKSMNKSVFLVAELSANHNQSFKRACELVKAAALSGADAVKVQTYTADTITIDCDSEHFLIQGGLWGGQTLYELYEQAAMPWEWLGDLMEVATEYGLIFFSSPFDKSSVQALEKIDCPLYKVASCELVDIPLLKAIAATGKPVIVSTGMGSCEEITEAVDTLTANGSGEITLLKCTTAYPAPPEEANLATMTDMRSRFGTRVGLSDHTLGSAVAIAAVALGADVVEKHFTLDRSAGGPDDSFSMEPNEFKHMVEQIRLVEKSLGKVDYSLTPKEKASVKYRRSLFVTQDIDKGDLLTADNLRSIRPGAGAHTRYYEDVLGQPVVRAIKRGTPFSLDMVKTAL